MCRRAYDSLKSLSLGQNYFLSLQIGTKKKKRKKYCPGWIAQLARMSSEYTKIAGWILG